MVFTAENNPKEGELGKPEVYYPMIRTKRM